ncbi:hypothetical protein DXG01_008752 [Tephrocybe rancida]|nr:hypothetical protein DXG01_008752 [Tephrocybe rancida]
MDFIFDYRHECRPGKSSNQIWLVDDDTGRAIGEEELRLRTFGLANALKSTFGIGILTSSLSKPVILTVVSPGNNDVVLIFSRNHVDYPVAIWAIHRLGAVVSGANPDFSSDELFYQLEQTNASLIITHPDSVNTALSAARRAKLPLDRLISFDTQQGSPGKCLSVCALIEKGLKTDRFFDEKTLKPGEAKTKLAFLSFSSGTTGKPKVAAIQSSVNPVETHGFGQAVAIPHYALIANVIQIAAHNNVNKNYCDPKDQRFRAGDVCIGEFLTERTTDIYGLVINAPTFIEPAQICIANNLAWPLKMTLVVVPKFNFVAMLNSIIRHRISHLIVIMCGAAPLSHEVNQQLCELLPDAHIGQAYGMTETCTATTMWPITQKRGISGSAGQLLPGTIARAVKSDGSLARYNEAGELYIKTPSVALGYANNAEAWVRTGDEVKIDQNGELWILDRLKVKGFQVAPAELEGCILDHPDVASACVVGMPDDYSGEVPLAFVVLTADARGRVSQKPTAADEIKASIIQHVAANKVNYKHLAGGVEFISVIPISPSGKLLRRVLRDKAKTLRQTRSKL